MQSLAELDRDSLDPEQQQILDELTQLWQEAQADPAGESAMVLAQLLTAAGVALAPLQSPTAASSPAAATAAAPVSGQMSSAKPSGDGGQVPAFRSGSERLLTGTASSLTAARADQDSPVLPGNRPVGAATGNPAADGNGHRIELLQALIARVSGESGARGQAASAPISLEARLDSGVSLANGTSPAQWAPVRVDSAKGQWSQDLMTALGDRLTMQINQQVKEATVRLDPPDLGRVDLTIRMDGDRLNVQLNATNPVVRDLLVQHAERLRAELLEQNLQTVDVQVGTGDGGQDRPDQPMETVIARQSMQDEADDSQTAERHENRWLSTSA